MKRWMFPSTLTTMKIFRQFSLLSSFIFLFWFIHLFLLSKIKTSANETEGKIKYYFNSNIFIMLLPPCSIFVHLKSVTTSTFSINKKYVGLFLRNSLFFSIYTVQRFSNTNKHSLHCILKALQYQSPENICCDAGYIRSDEYFSSD